MWPPALIVPIRCVASVLASTEKATEALPAPVVAEVMCSQLAAVEAAQPQLLVVAMLAVPVAANAEKTLLPVSWKVQESAVASVAVAEADPPPETVTEFTSGDAAFAATVTLTVIAEYPAPAARLSVRVQVRLTHVHPAPVIEASVRPAGRVSATVTVPLVGPAPA